MLCTAVNTITHTWRRCVSEYNISNEDNTFRLRIRAFIGRVLRKTQKARVSNI